jgi:hypothetical protein
MDCHGAARLAMTQEEVIALRLCHCAPALSLRHPSVIARNEAIHDGSRTSPWIATALRASQ